MRLRVQYNAPVVLTFAFLSLAVLALDRLTGGVSTFGCSASTAPHSRTP